MRVSTVGRYALRAMVDLASHTKQGPQHILDIAERQQMSEQYLAQLLMKLVHAQLLVSTRGPHGGYTLAYAADQIRAGDVLRAVRESFEPVFCVADDPKVNCPRIDGCPTNWLWAKLGDAISEVLDSVTLEELCQHARI